MANFRESAIWKQYPNAERCLKEGRLYSLLSRLCFGGLLVCFVPVVVGGIRQSGLTVILSFALAVVLMYFGSGMEEKRDIFNAALKQMDERLLELADALGITVTRLVTMGVDEIRIKGVEKLKEMIQDLDAFWADWAETDKEVIRANILIFLEMALPEAFEDEGNDIQVLFHLLEEFALVEPGTLEGFYIVARRESTKEKPDTT